MQRSSKTWQTNSKQYTSETVTTSVAEEQFDAFVITRMQFKQWMNEWMNESAVI